MRLDDYISTVRVVKRRTVAKEMIEGGRIKLNGKSVKPAHPVNVGDIIRVSYPDRYVEVEVADITKRSIMSGARRGCAYCTRGMPKKSRTIVRTVTIAPRPSRTARNGSSIISVVSIRGNSSLAA